MTETLRNLLRFSGAALILLAALHVPIAAHLKWREEASRMSKVNAAIFHVHTFFICCVLVMMGLPCLVDPAVFLDRSRAGAWLSWLFSVFWSIRLFFQWFVYPTELWRGKRTETLVHYCFTALWFWLTGIFAICGIHQSR